MATVWPPGFGGDKQAAAPPPTADLPVPATPSPPASSASSAPRPPTPAPVAAAAAAAASKPAPAPAFRPFPSLFGFHPAASVFAPPVDGALKTPLFGATSPADATATANANASANASATADATANASVTANAAPTVLSPLSWHQVPTARVHSDEALPRLPAGTSLKAAAGLVAEIAVVLGRRTHGPALGALVLMAAERRAAESPDEGAAWVATHYRLMAAQLDIGARGEALRVLLELAAEVEPAFFEERLAVGVLGDMIGDGRI